MRLGVISDTHGLLRPEVLQTLETCDRIVHAGDFDRETVLTALQETGLVYAVRGNNDFGGWAKELPWTLRFTAGGIQFFLVHDRMDVPRQLGETQVVIFGHTHQYFQQQNQGRLWFNPGSCGYPRFGGGLTMAVLTLENGQVEQIEKITLQDGRHRQWG